MVREDRRSGNYELDTCTEIGCGYHTHVFVYRTLPPFPNNAFSTFEGLPRFLNKVEEKAELAGDEAGIMSISRPCTDINDI